MSAPWRRTRGRTRPGRLRALDEYLCQRERRLLMSGPPAAAFIDVGFGVDPSTTLEAAAALRRLRPNLHVAGVELDPDRAAAARGAQDERTRFVHGGLDAAGAFAPALVVRAMNVLRAYPEADVPAFHSAWSSLLVEGGLLVEGSTDSEGHVAVAHLCRAREAGAAPLREALVFWTDFERGFAPILFRDWLPRDLRRRVVPGEAIHGFLARWTQAWSPFRAAGPAAAFAASVSALRSSGEPLEGDEWLGQNGYAVWRPEGGVPLPAAGAIRR